MKSVLDVDSKFDIHLTITWAKWIMDSYLSIQVIY